jgi:catechol 2,3-dioxygenase-like lactoylglutathione lyase family enzyme
LVSEKIRVPITGPLTHIDISIGYPERSIPFYAAFFGALGYRRWRVPMAEWQEPEPRRATWAIKYPNGARFDVEVRPARAEGRDRRYDRYEPGPHHLAFHAESRAVVDQVHQAMLAVGATVLDPPTDYGGTPGYDEGYYAVFFEDPDGMKLEVASKANPSFDVRGPMTR